MEEKMKEKIQKIVSKYSGVVGIIIKNKDGEKIKINGEVIFPSASLIKLFIAYVIEKNLYNEKIRIIDEVKVGGCGVLKNLTSNLELTIRDLIALMMCFSDNTATNILIDYLGKDKINKKIKELGFKNTVLGRKMMDNLAKLRGEDNYTTPSDVERVLDYLCADIDILKMLENQGYNNKINLYFSREEKYKFVHKTGELKNVEHDAGRLYFDNDWIDIIIMTKELLSNADGVMINNLIGKMVVDFVSKK